MIVTSHLVLMQIDTQVVQHHDTISFRTKSVPQLFITLTIRLLISEVFYHLSETAEKSSSVTTKTSWFDLRKSALCVFKKPENKDTSLIKMTVFSVEKNNAVFKSCKYIVIISDSAFILSQF